MYILRKPESGGLLHVPAVRTDPSALVIRSSREFRGTLVGIGPVVVPTRIVSACLTTVRLWRPERAPVAVPGPTTKLLSRLRILARIDESEPG